MKDSCPLYRYGELHKRAGLEIVNDMFMGSSLTFNNGVYYERDTPYIYDSGGNQTGKLDMDRFVPDPREPSDKKASLSWEDHW